MSDFYKEDGTPIACQSCGGTWFENNYHVVSEWGIMEYKVICVSCGESVAYWAYGSYDSVPYSNNQLK